MRHRADLRLSRWAKDFLDEEPRVLYHEVITWLYPDGESKQFEPKPVYSTAGAPEVTERPQRSPLGEQIPTRSYRFDDGREYGEFVQAVMEYPDGRRVYAVGLHEGTKWIIDSIWSLLEIRSLGGRILYRCTR